MKKKELFREMEEFNNMTPEDAIKEVVDFIGEYALECNVDERISDACKRLQTFVEEAKK